MGYYPCRSFYADILRDTLHQETGPTATRKVVLIVLRIIGKGCLFAGDRKNLFLAMLEISAFSPGSLLRGASGLWAPEIGRPLQQYFDGPTCLAVRDSRHAITEPANNPRRQPYASLLQGSEVKRRGDQSIQRCPG
jgi:hypothetical protein